MENNKILLVEDNPGDVELTKRALQKSNVTNGLIVVDDGVEALKYFFGEDGKSGCTVKDLPVVALLDHLLIGIQATGKAFPWKTRVSYFSLSRGLMRHLPQNQG